MQTPSPMEESPSPSNRARRETGRSFRWVAPASIVLFAFMLVNSAVFGAGVDFCKRTTEAALSSCKAGAQSDYSLALGKCDNLADAAARKVCQQQALADRKDALQTCKEQHDARQTVCARLGGAPYDPGIDPSNFVATIDNPFMALTPGTSFIYTGQVAQVVESNVVFVTHNTKVIDGVTCVEVRDTVFEDGVLTEDTLDWFAQDKAGNVWYFGENAKQLAGGLIVGLEGSFTAGVDGAKPGIVMEAPPAVSDFYRQEFLLGDAEDIAQVGSLTNSVTVAFGSFTNCLKTIETSPLEPGALENKFYASGIGLLLTIDLVSGERLELVQIQ